MSLQPTSILDLVTGPSGGEFFGLGNIPRTQETPPPDAPQGGLLTEEMLALINMLGMAPSGVTFAPDLHGELVPTLSFRPQSDGGAASSALASRQFGLNKLTSALSGFLQGTQDVAGRRMGAFQQATNLLPSLVDPSQKFFTGFEPEGALSQVAGRFGVPSTPVAIQHRQLDPAALAQTPPLDPMAAALIQQIQGA